MRILACMIIVSWAAVAADVIPSDRLIDWTYAGIPGGIPARTTVYTSFTSSATSANIQGGIDNCPSNQVVSLGAGTYTLTSALTVDRDGVTLRGTTNSYGVPTTILNFDANSGGWGLIDFAKTQYPENNWATTVSSVNVSSGLTRNSTQVILASALAGLSVGESLTFDQISDDDLVWDNGSQGGAEHGRPGTSPARTYHQTVVVTNVSGTTVDFLPPIFGHYWNASQDPEAWRYANGLSDIVRMSGVEDLSVVRTSGGDGTHNVHFGPAQRCWAKNVWVKQANGSNIRLAYTVQCEIRDCFMRDHDSIASATYSIWGLYSSSARIENNLSTNTPCAIGLQGVNGSFLGYNAGTNFPYVTAGWLPECVMIGHGGHTYANLFEGNWFPSVWGDWIHGNGSHNVYARNRLTGWETNKDSSTRPINFEQQNDTNAVVGNILGTDSYHTSYTPGGNLAIYNVEADADASLLRKGNYNTVDDGIRSSSPDETLGADTIAESYYYTGAQRPEHWGDRPWPPFDYASPTRSLLGFGGTNLPAIYRLLDANNSWPPASQAGGVSASRSQPLRLKLRP